MEWIKHPRNNPPKPGVIVEVCGNDCFGFWTANAMRVDYKSGSTKKQIKRKWRWLTPNGSIFDHHVEAWRPIN